MKKLYLYILLTIIWFMAIAARAQQAGALDTTFSADGKLLTYIGSGYAEGKGVAVQPDGKIVAGGYFNVSGTNNDFAVVRYTGDGALDNTFGSGGIASAGIGANNDNGNALTVQDDGKILLAGTTNNGSNSDLALVRFNSNGSLDNAFGNHGIVVTNLGANVEGASAILVQPDGKIVVGGTSVGNLSNNDFALVRYNNDGTLDSTFGYGGIVKTDINNSYDQAHALVIQADGKIIACGTTIGTNQQDFAAVRYNADGTLDNSFGNGGKSVTVIGGGVDEAYSAALQLDGKIILAGTSDAGSNSNYDFAMIRLNTDGTLDLSFGSWGKVITGLGANDKGNAVVLQSDGKIVLAGSSVNGSGSDFAIARYNINGSPDNTFDYDGKLTTDFGGYDIANAIAIQNDGNIVVCGTSLQTKDVFAVARYIGNVNLGVIEKTKKEKLLVYFNTYTGDLVVSGTEEKGQVSVFDIIGNKVAVSESANKRTILNVGPVSPGVYLMNYENGKNSSGVKFVIR